MKRYATDKDMRALEHAVQKLAENILSLAQWQAYHTIKENPHIITPKMRQEILAQTLKGDKMLDKMLHYLYNELFRQNPPISSNKAVEA